MGCSCCFKNDDNTIKNIRNNIVIKKNILGENNENNDIIHINIKNNNNKDIDNNDDKNKINSNKKTEFKCQQVNSFSILIPKKTNEVIIPNVINQRLDIIPRYVQNYIYKQKEKCVCKIKNNNNSFGTGFFCNIPFPDYLNFLPVLITNNHVLGINDITPNSSITISINDETSENDIYKIIIGDNRLTYTDPFYDVTIIELKKDDKLAILGLEVDYDEYEAPLEQFKKNQIYLIHYPKSKNVCKSLGEINDIAENDLTIRHTCATDSGSSGSPIIKLNNLKVIGIHKGSLDTINFNIGTFIKGPIEKFNEIHKKVSEVSRPGLFTFLKYIDYKEIHVDNMVEKKKKIENDICIRFLSSDQKLYVSIPCSLENSLFVDIEKKLYKIYPEYKNLNLYYLGNGIRINRFKTIKENKLKDNDMVLINRYEDDE